MYSGNLCKNFLAALYFPLIIFFAMFPWTEHPLTFAAEGHIDDEAKPMTIVLAGGCFWGVQEYFSRIPGVLGTETGYAQSRVPHPSYQQVCSGATHAAEAVRITFDPAQISLDLLLRHFFRIIDPLAVNRQGNDLGTQYRTGIYYEDNAAREAAEKAIARESSRLGVPLAVELEPLTNFYPAETYHQDYLKKNPGGYCHINFASLNDPDLAPASATTKAHPESKSELKQRLSPLAWHVTQENGTEPPFTGQYNDFDQPGIYVDVVSGQPLFSSLAKFPSSCGWPSFAAPIAQDAVTAREDLSHGMQRLEIRSSQGDSHLGHVFPDGPKELGGLRFCINSAALRFIPAQDLEKEGYGSWSHLFQDKKDENN